MASLAPPLDSSSSSGGVSHFFVKSASLRIFGQNLRSFQILRIIYGHTQVFSLEFRNLRPDEIVTVKMKFHGSEEIR